MLKTIVGRLLFSAMCLALIGMLGCGGGGESDSDDNSDNDTGSRTIDDLVGTYSIETFTVSDGSTTITDGDADSFSGTLLIYSNGEISITITLVADGEEYNATSSGTILEVGNTYLTLGGDGCTFDVSYSLIGDIFTYSRQEDTCGYEYTTTITASRTSYSASQLYTTENFDEQCVEGGIWGAFGTLMR